jgi:hypothetical protein
MLHNISCYQSLCSRFTIFSNISTWLQILPGAHKSQMDMYYTLRTALLEFYANHDPMLPEIQTILKSG